MNKAKPKNALAWGVFGEDGNLLMLFKTRATARAVANTERTVERVLITIIHTAVNRKSA